MNVPSVLYMLGRLWVALALILVAPAAVAFAYAGPDRWSFVGSIGSVFAVGVVLARVYRPRGEFEEFDFGRHEAFWLVTLAWVSCSVVGALPWIWFHGLGFTVDGLFEGAAGFSTTGASILTDIEAQPAGLLFWRSLSQWLGGMGIIVLGIAILPKLEVGGLDLLGAEAPGPIQEKLTPRIAHTAKTLWLIYALFTLLETGLLWAVGMTPLEALNHALTTMSTGGFSTRNAGVGHYQSASIEMIITVFMFLAGLNFALHFQVLRGRGRVMLSDPEARLYTGIVVVATVLIAGDLIQHMGHTVLDALRLAVFQVLSVQTTTGFASDDYDRWPEFSKALLFALMFVGACAGSTSGSVKVVRHQIAFKKLAADLRQLVQPHVIVPVRSGKRPIPEEIVNGVTSFMYLFFLLWVLGGLALAATGLDMVSAFSASVACLANVGPGFGAVGAAQNYAALWAPAKLLLVVLMIVGRLELYTVLVLLFIWRRGSKRIPIDRDDAPISGRWNR